jgi:hypothetical protein
MYVFTSFAHSRGDRMFSRGSAMTHGFKQSRGIGFDSNGIHGEAMGTQSLHIAMIHMSPEI